MEAIEVCSWFDSALDRKAMMASSPTGDMSEWAALRDMDSVRVLPGKTATKFTIRPLSRSEMRWVKQGADEPEKRERAFSLAVTRVLDLADRDGKVIADFRPTGNITLRAGQVPAMSDEDLDRIPDCYLEDIGGVAFVLSFFPPGTALRFPLPHLWQLGSVVRHSPLADEEDSTRSGTDGSERPKEPQGQTSLPPGGPSGVAVAAMVTTDAGEG